MRQGFRQIFHLLFILFIIPSELPHLRDTSGSEAPRSFEISMSMVLHVSCHNCNIGISLCICTVKCKQRGIMVFHHLRIHSQIIRQFRTRPNPQDMSSCNCDTPSISFLLCGITTPSQSMIISASIDSPPFRLFFRYIKKELPLIRESSFANHLFCLRLL